MSEIRLNHLLCNFAHRFSILTAEILESDRHKRRNFREETITDLLMAGLVPFEPLGIITDYPANESLTGEDMDWEFVNMDPTGGQSYLRLHIQAKRARLSESKMAPYWYYKELDHAVASGQHGTQHKLLIDNAPAPGSVPLYMFYHPNSALPPAAGILPAVSGVNWIFADDIPVRLTPELWPRKVKKLDTWRSKFHDLSQLLCFGSVTKPTELREHLMRFLVFSQLPSPTPAKIATRLNNLRQSTGKAEDDRPRIRAVSEIPPATQAAIDAAYGRRGTAIERADVIKRPRVIFVSNWMWET